MEFSIRTNALKILTHIYLSCGSNLEFNKVDCKLICKEHAVDDVMKSIYYLMKKGYIETNYMSAILSGSLSAEGIDWVEACHNVSLDNQS